MRKHTPLYGALVTLLIASLACSLPGGATPDITATFAVALTQAFATAQAGVPTSAVPSNTPAPTAGSAATATPLTLPQATSIKPTDTQAPTNTPGVQGCSDGAQYVADVTIPDNTVLNPGQAFTKTWRLQNSGTCTWVAAYQFAYVADNQMGGPGAVNISGNVAPASLYDVSVNFVAPTTPGTYKSSWRMKNASGQFFGSVPFVQIVVAAPTATFTNTSVPATITATASATTVILGANANDYGGNWFNNNVGTGGITQIQIAPVSATQINIHAWGRCHPSDCDWGVGSGSVSGNTITVNNFPGASGEVVTLSVLSAGALHVVNAPDIEDFHIGPLATDWVGNWVNLNAGTNNITHIVITSSGGQITIHPYGKCAPTDCDMGAKTYAFANPLNASDLPHSLTLNMLQANLLQVVDNKVSITDNFAR